MLAFLTVGLYAFSDLRELYLRPLGQPGIDGVLSGDELLDLDASSLADLVGRRWLLWRYLSLALAAGTTFALWRVLRADGLAVGRWRGAAALLGFAALLWVLTSEMIQWLDLAGARSTYKLGVSILWGVYALALLALGLWRRRALWRQAAIALFALTLVKLFFYDLASLDTLARTIVLVALGVLLLLTSFLYSKYKYLVVQPDEPPQEV